MTKIVKADIYSFVLSLVFRPILDTFLSCWCNLPLRNKNGLKRPLFRFICRLGCRRCFPAVFVSVSVGVCGCIYGRVRVCVYVCVCGARVPSGVLFGDFFGVYFFPCGKVKIDAFFSSLLTRKNGGILKAVFLVSTVL